MNYKVFAVGMDKLTDCFPDYELKDGTMAAYWDFLKDLDPDVFLSAVVAHTKRHKWFPKISEILDVVRDQGPTVIDIWNRLLTAAEMGQKPEMDTITEKALAVLGGWEAFQYTPIDILHYRFKDFKAALQGARAQDTLQVVSIEKAVLPEPEGIR